MHTKSILLTLTSAMLAVIFFPGINACKAEEQTPDNLVNTIASTSYLVQSPVHPPKLPDSVDFAGEQVPINRFDVRESLDREISSNSFFHSNMFLYIKRAARWFPIIEPILKENGVPDDFKYLAVIESGLTNVVSPAGAAGYWQFMQRTAIEYGLEVNTEVDMRYEMEASTKAACKYLLAAKKKYGSWTNAAASYNMGFAGLDRQRTQQKVDNYYDLWLNEESSRYVFRIIAIKLIMSEPAKYGFEIDDSEMYHIVPYSVVEVDGAVSNWADFALKHNSNYKLLRWMNPWIKSYSLTNAKAKTYKVKIPLND